MKEDKDYLQALFTRYLQGECTPEEAERLLDYFERDERAIQELVRQELGSPVVVGAATRTAVSKVHGKLLKTIGGSKTTGRWLFTSGMAAVWLALLVSAGALFYYFQAPQPPLEQFEETVTDSGERKKLVLDDGSVVWLNAASKLYYPTVFAAGTREVSLEGEAYFDVASDSGRPFIIRSGELKTTVVGTSFNIRAYKEDKTLSVAVVTGKVKVASEASDKELQLTPDQQAVFDKSDRQLVKQEGVLATSIASWKEGQLRFRNTTFSEVTATLQRSHNVRITFDPMLENCPIVYADFDESEPIETILDMLLISVNGKVHPKNKSTYHLTGTVACGKPTNP